MKKVNQLNKSQMKKILGGLLSEDDTVCRECETDANCSEGRTCHPTDVYCKDGTTKKTRCMIPTLA